MMRPVTVFEHKPVGDEGKCSKVFKVNGVFHTWGSDIIEYDDTVAAFTVAIVELSDGTVINPPAELIKFLDVGEPPKTCADVLAEEEETHS